MLVPDRAQRYATARAAMAALKGCRDASLAGQDLLAQVMAERVPSEAPRRSAGTPAVGVPTSSGATAPPRPAMLSSPNQVTWMAPAERAAFQAAETNTRVGASGAGYAQAGATPGPTAVTGARGGKRWWPLAVGGGAAIAAGISIAVMAGRGGNATPAVAPGSGAASDAAAVAPVDAAVPAAPPDAVVPAAAMPPDAGVGMPPDAGTRHGSGSGHRPPKPGAGAGPGSNAGSGIHEINVGGGG
jgi:hypothetical protein